MFCILWQKEAATGVVNKMGFLKKFRKIHWKTPVPESLF